MAMARDATIRDDHLASIGETEDSTIADPGSRHRRPAKSRRVGQPTDRVCKYNQLLRIRRR
jgi:enolase